MCDAAAPLARRQDARDSDASLKIATRVKNRFLPSRERAACDAARGCMRAMECHGAEGAKRGRKQNALRVSRRLFKMPNKRKLRGEGIETCPSGGV